MPPSAKAIQAARDRFAAWLRWYMDVYKKEAPTQAALAKLIGVTPAALSYLLEPGSERVPDLKTLLGAAEVLGYSIDHILSRDPPPVRPQ